MTTLSCSVVAVRRFVEVGLQPFHGGERFSSFLWRGNRERRELTPHARAVS